MPFNKTWRFVLAIFQRENNQPNTHTTKPLNTVVGVINDPVPGCTCRLNQGIHQQRALGLQKLKEKINPPKLIKAKRL